MNNTSQNKGLKWGPFVARIPFIHIRFRAAEFFQGMVISGATAFAGIPIVMGMGLTFEEGVAVSLVAGTLIAAGPILFGVPFAPGWVTPAYPIVIGVFATMGYYSPVGAEYQVETFQFMAALSIEFTLLVAFLGVTGLSSKIVNNIPNTLKSGIILGAAIAAFYQVFFKEFDSKYMEQPVAMTIALAICILTTFSVPFKKLATSNKIFQKISSLGLLPGFVIAATVAYIIGEATLNITWGFKFPDVVTLFERTSPFSIGFPPLNMYIDALPLVIIGYILLFGDIITGKAILKDPQKERPDEPLDVDVNKVHLSIAIRNFLGLIANPNFPTQGALWTGVHVVVAERWRKGPKEMPSIFDGLGSYYLMAIPFLYVTLPFVTLMQPLMNIALNLTLVLTGFACAYVALAIPKTNAEMASALLIGLLVAFSGEYVWVALLIGILLSVFVVGLNKKE
ncbi:MAG TPA: hypothetical protein EYO80_02395 [Candidatus Marinimicrobia bacterium]|nr:hypothetical protein [Candidatus Neomarinimicrobiota bacterium]